MKEGDGTYWEAPESKDEGQRGFEGQEGTSRKRHIRSLQLQCSSLTPKHITSARFIQRCTEALIRQCLGKGNAMRQVSYFFSSSTALTSSLNPSSMVVLMTRSACAAEAVMALRSSRSLYTTGCTRSP